MAYVMDPKPVKKTESTLKEAKHFDDKNRNKSNDGGDTLKKYDGVKTKLNDTVNSKIIRKPLLSDRGDVPITSKITKTQSKANNNKNDKVKTIEKNKTTVEIKPKLGEGCPKDNYESEQISNDKTSENNAGVNKRKVGDINIGDKSSLRSKIVNPCRDNSKHVMKKDIKHDRLKNQASSKSVIHESKQDDLRTVEESGKEKEYTGTTTVHRKPLIKTVKSKNDNKVYKAVTFTEQKRVKPTVLEINIPNIMAKKTRNKVTDKYVEMKPSVPVANNKSASKLSLKDKLHHQRRNRLTERTKRKKLNRCISSPDKFKKVESPPTEVAKWAPSSINPHTKPYYEAWVDTTLAAISKISKKDKLYLEKQNIIKTFQKSLQLRTESPELVHADYTDECYTGRIKIKQKHLPKKSRQPLITPLL